MDGVEPGTAWRGVAKDGVGEGICGTGLWVGRRSGTRVFGDAVARNMRRRLCCRRWGDGVVSVALGGSLRSGVARGRLWICGWVAGVAQGGLFRLWRRWAT